MTSLDHAERRAEAVERLRRPMQRRSLFDRRHPREHRSDDPALASERSVDATGGSRPDGADPAPGEFRRRSTVPFDPVVRARSQARSTWSITRVGAPVLIGVLVLAVALGWLLLRRPAPVDETLPFATAAGTTDSGGDTSVTASTTTSSDQATGATAAVPANPALSGSSNGADAATSVMVHVAGAVASPGVVSLAGGSRVVDAVSAAGGLRPDADPDRVNLAAQLIDGARIVIPVAGQPPPMEVNPTSGDTGGTSPKGSPGSPAVVDVNQATAEQLDALPGVGPATAKAIIDHRDKNGRFGSVDDLLEVRGIGDAKLDSLRDLVTVGR